MVVKLSMNSRSTVMSLGGAATVMMVSGYFLRQTTTQ